MHINYAIIGLTKTGGFQVGRNSSARIFLYVLCLPPATSGAWLRCATVQVVCFTSLCYRWVHRWYTESAVHYHFGLAFPERSCIVQTFKQQTRIRYYLRLYPASRLIPCFWDPLPLIHKLYSPIRMASGRARAGAGPCSRSASRQAAHQHG